MCQDLADSLDEGVGIDAIVIDFSEAFDLGPHDRLLMKLVASGVDSWVVIWVREFLVGCTPRVRVGGQLSKEVKVISGMLQGSVLGPLLFVVYVNDIWRNINSCIRLFTDDCIIYRKIINKNNLEKLQKDLDNVGEWAVENVMKINPSKSKATRFMRARFKNPLGYCVGDQKIPAASSCKYLGIILQSDLFWVDQVNYTVQKAWKALHVAIRVLKKGNRNTESSAYTSLVCPVLEYGSGCWDPCREGQINVLDQVQKKAAQFTNDMKDSDWGTLAQRRMIAHLCALLKVYSGEWAWKAIHKRL